MADEEKHLLHIKIAGTQGLIDIPMLDGQYISTGDPKKASIILSKSCTVVVQ